jgi:hypothetical protein
MRYLPTSLLSAAHTVKPSLEPPTGAPEPGPERKPVFKFIALGAVSAVIAVAGAAGVSHLRARPAPVMQIVSGSPVLKKSADGDNVRWHAQKTTVYLDASLDQVGNQAREAVQLGFGTWLSSGAKLPGLSFDSTKGAQFGSKPNGKSEIMYGPITIKGHENDLALTITFSDPDTGEVLEADMIFNSTHPFALLSSTSQDDDSAGPTRPASMGMGQPASCQGKYDLQSVATHEVGHFFGLGEDYDVKTATMYYTTGRCETNKRVLQSSDETTMSALYVAGGSSDMSSASASSAADTGKGCGGARIGLGRTDGEGSLAAVLGLLGFVSWRRRRR